MPKPKASRVPASGKPTAKYSRGKIGEPLQIQFAKFDLTDSNFKQICGTYNCFHDPLLKNFFRQPEKRKQLLKHRLVTDDNKVLCSLKEFNQYTKYIKSVQLNWTKVLLKQQKLLLKDFMLQQMKGRIPEDVSFAHMRESLISESKSKFRTFFKKVLKPGETLHDAELKWERTQRLQLEELRKEINRELRLEGRLYQFPVGSSKLGAAMSAQPSTHAPASVHERQTLPNMTERITSKKKKRAGGGAMMVKDLQHFQHKPAIGTEEQEMDSPHLKVPIKLVSSVLGKIQGSPCSDVSLSKSSSESSEVLSFSGRCVISCNSPPSLDPVALIVSPTSKDAMDLMKIQDSTSSGISLMDLEMSSDSLQTSCTSSRVRSCLDSIRVSPTSEVIGDNASGVLKNIQDSTSSGISLMDLEMSFDSLQTSRTSSRVRSCLDSIRVSPTSEVIGDNVSGVLKNIQDSTSSGISLMDLEMSSDSLQTSRTSSRVRSCLDSQRVSPTSEVAGNIVSGVLNMIHDSSSSGPSLLDLEKSSNGLQTSRTFSHIRSCLDSQRVSPTSEVAVDLVSGVLSKIQDSSSSGLSLLDLETSSESLQTSPTNSHKRSCLNAQKVSPTSEVAVDLVSGVLRNIQDSSSSGLSLMDLEMSSDNLQTSRTSSYKRSSLNAQRATSAVAVDLVNGVLRKIRSSTSSDLSLMDLETSSNSLQTSRTFSHKRSCLNAQRASPSLAVTVSGVLSKIQDSSSSDLFLMDFETSSDSLPESPTSSSSSFGSDKQIVSSASEDAEDLVKGVLRNIQELPSSDWNLPEPQFIRSSELQNLSEMHRMQSSPASIVSSDATQMDLEMLLDSHSAHYISSSLSSHSDAHLVSPSAEDLVSDILRRTEESPFSDLSLLDSAPLSKDNSTGKNTKSKARKQVFDFFSRPLGSMRQIFTNARSSNHIL